MQEGGHSELLVTKLQAEEIVASWGVRAELPRTPAMALVVTWPKSADVDCECAKVTKTDRKSDYGERLYLIAMGSVSAVLGLKAPAANAPAPER